MNAMRSALAFCGALRKCRESPLCASRWAVGDLRSLIKLHLQVHNIAEDTIMEMVEE